MRRLLRTLALLAAVALIGYGMFQPEDRRWLICIWGAAPLLMVALWPPGDGLVHGMRRALLNLGVVLGVLMLMLSAQLLRLQVVRASHIYNQTVQDEQGHVTSNVRLVREAMRVIRGDIVDRRGQQLASSEQVEGGFAVRTYPIASTYNLEAFSNLLGYVSVHYGLSRLEDSYKEYLTGERGSTWDHLQDDLFNRQHRGNNLHLTIDARLQAAAYDALNGRQGSVVLLDPTTGAVLAMASFPGFDPQALIYNPASENPAAENERISQYWGQINTDERRPLLNRPTQGLYAPGSTFKTVTAVGVLNNQDIGKPNDITCPDTFVPEAGAPPVVNAVRQNLARFTGNPTDLKRAFAFSCNTAFAQYGLRLGQEGLVEIAEAFHIYSPEDAPELSPDMTDLPLATSYVYLNEDYLDTKAAQAATAYGQGELLVTPLQMALVAAAIANDGEMMRAYLVDRITDAEGNVVQTTRPRATGSRIMTPEVARETREIMRAVVEEGYEGALAARVPNVTVGGKSGTAEVGEGVPTHAWFIAVAPLDKPRYAVAVMVENGGEGTSVGGQLAGQVLRAAFELEGQP